MLISMIGLTRYPNETGTRQEIFISRGIAHDVIQSYLMYQTVRQKVLSRDLTNSPLQSSN